MFECLGQQCQKQPSTRIATRNLDRTKSGLTRNSEFETRNFSKTCRRQPVILLRRNKRTSAISVSLFPRPRIRDITSDRFALVKTLFGFRTKAVSIRICDDAIRMNGNRNNVFLDGNRVFVIALTIKKLL